MRFLHKCLSALTVATILASLAPVASIAAVASTLVVSSSSGDIAQVHITGSSNSAIQLYFYPSGASLPTSVAFGTTDNNGNFSTNISSGSYGIPSGAQSYVIIGGQQSPTTAWATYASTISFSQTSVTLSVGQSTTITASATPTVSFNSNTGYVATSVSGNQLTITGNATGSVYLTVCGANSGCGVITVTVGASTGNKVGFSQNNIALKVSQTATVNLSYTSATNYTVSGNTNASAVSASISGMSSVLVLYGLAAGSSTVTVCSANDPTSCSSLYVSVAGSTSSAATTITFSQNTLSLGYGQSGTVTVTGDPNNNYFVSSNSNSNVASVGLSGTTVTVTGGSTAGTTTVSICSVSSTNVCGSLYVTVASAGSSSAVSFSQNNISLGFGQTLAVTLYGGSGSNYFVSSNSNSGAVTYNINGNQLSVTAGSTAGTAAITVCSASLGTACAALTVTATSAPTYSPITISQTTLTLNPAQTGTVTLGGGSTNYYVSTASSSGLVNTSISGTTLSVNAGTNAGSTTLSICDRAASNSCVTLFVTVNTYISPLTFGQNNITLSPGQVVKITGYYSGAAGGGIQVISNTNSAAANATVTGNAITITGGSVAGTDTISFCSVNITSDCANVYTTTVVPVSTPTPSVATPVETTPATTAVTTLSDGYKFTRQLLLGSVGADVRELQKRLVAEGLYSGPITGRFASLTQTAVKRFQKKYGLQQLGIVGPATRAQLNK